MDTKIVSDKLFEAYTTIIQTLLPHVYPIRMGSDENDVDFKPAKLLMDIYDDANTGSMFEPLFTINAERSRHLFAWSSKLYYLVALVEQIVFHHGDKALRERFRVYAAPLDDMFFDDYIDTKVLHEYIITVIRELDKDMQNKDVINVILEDDDIKNNCMHYLSAYLKHVMLSVILSCYNVAATFIHELFLANVSEETALRHLSSITDLYGIPQDTFLKIRKLMPYILTNTENLTNQPISSLLVYQEQSDYIESFVEFLVKSSNVVLSEPDFFSIFGDYIDLLKRESDNLEKFVAVVKRLVEELEGLSMYGARFLWHSLNFDLTDPTVMLFLMNYVGRLLIDVYNDTQETKIQFN